MKNNPKSRTLPVAILALFLLTMSLSGCRSEITNTERIIVPIDNGRAVPDVVIIHEYDDDKNMFNGLLMTDGSFIFIKESDISGAVLMPRERAIELLAKEGALTVLVENNKVNISDALKAIQDEEKLLNKKAKKEKE